MNIPQHYLDIAIFIIKGAHITVFYGFISMFLGFCISLLLTLLAIKKSYIVQTLIKFYVSAFRGTPMLLQLSIFYFGIPSISTVNINATFAAILALSLNSGAYLYEILRGSINSIPTGQHEAAKVLGIKENFIMKDILLPQALKNLSPALTNELITLLKDTSLLSVLGIQDMMFRSKLVAAEKFNWFLPLIIAGVIYYLLVLIISSLSRKFETYFKLSK